MANIASTIVRVEGIQLVLMAHNRARLTDEEWERGYLAAVREIRATAGPTNSANLVFAEGSGPNAKQRTTGNAIFDSKGSYQFHVSVITDSMMVRGAVTVFSWFNPLISAFSPSDWRAAFAHVRISRPSAPEIIAGLQHLKSQVPDVGVLNEVLTRI